MSRRSLPRRPLAYCLSCQQRGLFGAGPAGGTAPGAALRSALDGLNERFGRGTGQLAAALGPTGGGSPPWQGPAAGRTPAYPTRLADLRQAP